MLNPTFGIANVWLERLGFNSVDFLHTRSYDVSVFGIFMVWVGKKNGGK